MQAFIPEGVEWGLHRLDPCRPVRFFHNKLGKLSLYGPGFVHRDTAMLKQRWLLSKISLDSVALRFLLIETKRSNLNREKQSETNITNNVPPSCGSKWAMLFLCNTEMHLFVDGLLLVRMCVGLWLCKDVWQDVILFRVHLFFSPLYSFSLMLKYIIIEHQKLNNKMHLFCASFCECTSCDSSLHPLPPPHK